jgi:excisionase family DNA binding protein
MKDFISVSELAERWSISGQSVRRKIRSGAIPHLKTPGSRSLRVPIEFIRRYEAAFPHAVVTTPITTHPAPTTVSISTAI